MTARAATLFRKHLGDPTGAVVARAPGRVNLIGEHTDYNDFEVSHPALDRLVEEALQVDGVLGSRLTGAGFGGCTVSLVAETALPDFQKRLQPLVDDWPTQSIVIGTPEQARVTEVIG